MTISKTFLLDVFNILLDIFSKSIYYNFFPTVLYGTGIGSNMLANLDIIFNGGKYGFLLALTMKKNRIEQLLRRINKKTSVPFVSAENVRY